MYQTIAETFEVQSLRRFFCSEAASETLLTVLFQITDGDQDDYWTLIIDGGTFCVHNLRSPKYDILFATSKESYFDIVNDKLSLPLAYMKGLIQVDGTVSKLTQFLNCFRKQQ